MSMPFASIKQADYILLYEQNWLKEGTEGLVLKITAESSKQNLYQTDRSDYHTLTVRFCIKSLGTCLIYPTHLRTNP